METGGSFEELCGNCFKFTVEMSTRRRILCTEEQVKFHIREKLVMSCFMFIKKIWQHKLMCASIFSGLRCTFLRLPCR